MCAAEVNASSGVLTDANHLGNVANQSRTKSYSAFCGLFFFLCISSNMIEIQFTVHISVNKGHLQSYLQAVVAFMLSAVVKLCFTHERFINNGSKLHESFD